MDSCRLCCPRRLHIRSPGEGVHADSRCPTAHSTFEKRISNPVSLQDVSHIGKWVITVSSSAAWTESLHGDVQYLYLTTSAIKYIITGSGPGAVCLAGPEHGVYPGDCDHIPLEPQATTCIDSGGSIKVLANGTMAVVMFSPFGEASPADPQRYSDAINRALWIYTQYPAAHRGFYSSVSVGWVQRQLSLRGGAPRAVAVLPSLHHQGLQEIEIGIASPEGHVYRTGFQMGPFEIEVIVLGPQP